MDCMGIIFSNIYDSSMGALTAFRTSASIPFGGRYRQIDFILSNMSNSGIRDIGIITKYNYQSLMDHLGTCEEWDLKLGDGVRFLPPYATGHTGAYRGKLEALQTALPVLERNRNKYVVLADTTVLCSIDFTEVVEQHEASGCDVTVVAKRGIADGTTVQPVALKLDADGKVVDLAMDYAAPKDYAVGMSMFVMSREKLIEIIHELVPHGKYHLERDFLLGYYNDHKIKVNVYQFHNVALFNENVEQYYNNSMALLDESVRHSLFRGDISIYTKVRDAVPTRFGMRGQAADCVIADGCHINGYAEHSVLFREVVIEKEAQVRDCIVMQGCRIGKGAKLRYVILDKNVVIEPGVELLGSPGHPEVIGKNARISKGANNR